METLQKILMSLERLDERLGKLESAGNKEVMTVAEVAAYMGVHPSHVYGLIEGKKPKLKSSQPGGKLRFIKRSDLLEYLTRNATLSAVEIDTITRKTVNAI